MATAREVTSTDPSDPGPSGGREALAESLGDAGRLFHQRGWSVGTSSNYSVVLQRAPLRLLITASGKDKGRLGPADFVEVDEHGAVCGDSTLKSSAETLLHVTAAQWQDVGAVLHTHSVWATLLSDHFFAAGRLRIEGFEMLKGIESVTTHEASIELPIFDNTQDIAALSAEVRECVGSRSAPPWPGYLIRRHGLYTWGRDIEAARRHVEVLEFLLECIGRQLSMDKT